MADHDSIVSSDKIKAIADAIRDKTHKSGKLTLDQMPDEIESISGGGGETPECGIVPTEYSDKGYVLSANSYGNVQAGVMYHDTTEYSGLDPHDYDTSTDPFAVTYHALYSSRTYNYITDISFITAPEIIGETAFKNCFWLDISELPEGLEIIGDYAFQNCHNLCISEIPESVASIGVCAFQYTCRPDSICPTYDSTESYSAGDTVYYDTYIYTCFQDAGSGYSPMDSRYWVEGYYPELVGIYDESTEYADGAIVYYNNPNGMSGVYTVYHYIDRGDMVWATGYCPDVIGLYDSSHTYHIGDVVVEEWGGGSAGETRTYTCCVNTPTHEPGSGYDWVDGDYPDITGVYDPTVEYHAGDVVVSLGDGATDYSIYTAIKTCQDVDPEYDYHGEHWAYGYFPLLQGEYSSSKTYAVGDVIVDTDSSGGTIYTCISPVTSPEEIDYSKWAQGYYPEMLGMWDENTEYHPGDIVALEYSDSYWVYTAIRTSTGVYPSDSDYWIYGYYPDLLGVYDSSNTYNVGDAVYVDESFPEFYTTGEVFTLAQTAEPHQATGLFYDYIPDMKGVYYSTQIYQLCDIVLHQYNGEYQSYICNSATPITGAWDDQYWEEWSDGKVTTLTFKGTPETVDPYAFSDSGYNVALVPWASNEGPSIYDFSLIIYEYSPQVT